MNKIKLPLSRIGNGKFIPALNALLSIPLPNSRDTYALARTLDLLEPELVAHNKALNSLIIKHGGVSNLADLRSKIKEKEHFLAGAVAEELKSDVKAQIEKHKAEERRILATTGERFELSTDSPNWDQFIKERTELETTPVELFLDHKVKLPETNMALTAMQIRELMDLVEC